MQRHWLPHPQKQKNSQEPLEYQKALQGLRRSPNVQGNKVKTEKNPYGFFCVSFFFLVRETRGSSGS